MRYWASVAFVHDPRQLPELAKACDEAGFEGVVIPDHLVLPAVVDSYPYTDDGSARWPDGTPWPDPWVTIGAMAAVTERLRFVTGVYVLGARNLFVTAKAVGTAAVLSGGRVLLGVGSGWCRQEFELGGQPFAGRGERMEETIEALRVLWRDEAPEFEGRFTKFSGVDVRPLPPGPVPVLVGGDSDRALRRAATIGDGWIGLDYKEDRLLERLEVLRRLREEAGRTAGPFEIIAAVRARPDPAMHERLAAAGVTGLIAVPWLSTRKDPAPLENKIEAIQQFARTFT